MAAIEKIFGFIGVGYALLFGGIAYMDGLTPALNVFPWWGHIVGPLSLWIGVATPLSKPRIRRPKVKRTPKQKPRKVATPPTARVADLSPLPAQHSMDEGLRRFVAKGFRAIQDENAPSP